MALHLRACVPPKYFLPVNTHDNCSHTSFALPSLKYLQDIFNHTAAVNMCVGPFRGLCFKQVASGTGSSVFLTFSFFSSSDVRAFLSSMGFKNPSGIFSCTSGRTAPLITDIRVVLSVIFARAATFAHTSDRCSCAWAT